MNDPYRRHLLQAALLLGSGLAWRPVRACEFYAATLRVSHPWTRATAQAAGFAALSLRFDEVSQDDRLLAVLTPVAEGAALVRAGEPGPLPLDIPAGRETVLAESGLHVRLLNLTQPLELARSYPLQLVFERGGVINALLNVDYGRFA